MLQITFDLFDTFPGGHGYVKGEVFVEHIGGTCTGTFTFDTEGVVVYEYGSGEICETLFCEFRITATNDTCLCPPQIFTVTIVPRPENNEACTTVTVVPCASAPPCAVCTGASDFDCLLHPFFQLNYDQATGNNAHLLAAEALIFSKVLEMDFTDKACRYMQSWDLSTGGDARAQLFVDSSGIGFEFRLRDETDVVIGIGIFYRDCANIECDRRYDIPSALGIINGSYPGPNNETNWIGAVVNINPISPGGFC